MNKELAYKIYKAIEVSVAMKTGMDGLIDLMDSIMYYELKSFADEVGAPLPQDVALMSYMARHHYRRGYAKRQAEIDAAIIKALSARKPEKIKKMEQLPQITEQSPHSPTEAGSGRGEATEPSDNIS